MHPRAGLFSAGSGQNSARVLSYRACCWRQSGYDPDHRAAPRESQQRRDHRALLSPQERFPGRRAVSDVGQPSTGNCRGVTHRSLFGGGRGFNGFGARLIGRRVTRPAAPQGLEGRHRCSRRSGPRDGARVPRCQQAQVGVQNLNKAHSAALVGGQRCFMRTRQRVFSGPEQAFLFFTAD